MQLLTSVHTVRLSVSEAPEAKQAWLVEHGRVKLRAATLFEASQLACELAVEHWKRSGESTQLLIQNRSDCSWHPVLRLGHDPACGLPRSAANSCD